MLVGQILDGELRKWASELLQRPLEPYAIGASGVDVDMRSLV